MATLTTPAPVWLVPVFNGRGTRTAHAILNTGTVAVCGHRVGGFGLTGPPHAYSAVCKRCSTITGTTPAGVTS